MYEKAKSLSSPDGSDLSNSIYDAYNMGWMVLMIRAVNSAVS